MGLDTIIAKVLNERIAQDQQWGGPDHDDTHTPTDWVAILSRHVGLSAMDAGQIDPAIWRRQMIRVAAVAIAALESFDRLNRPPQPDDKPLSEMTGVTFAKENRS